MVTRDGELLVGPSLWSLVAVPLVLLGIFVARHGWGVVRVLGGGDPYEGHGAKEVSICPSSGPASRHSNRS